MRPGMLLLALFFALAACGNGLDSNQEAAEKLVARGKRALAASQFQTASATFARAIELDGANKEAKFGHALSELLVFYEQVSLVVRAAGFGDLVPKSADARPGDGMSDEADMYNRLILQLLLPMRDSLARAAAELDEVKGEDFRFAIDELPVKWNTDTSLNLHGTWREGDVRMLGGIAHVFAGLLDFVAAHELRLDLFDTLDYLSSYAGGFSSIDLNLPRILNLVVHVLEANPQFLQLMSRDADANGLVDGEEIPPRVRAHMQSFALDWSSMRALVERRPGLLKAEAGRSGTLATLTWSDALVVGYDAAGALEYGTIAVPITEGFEAGLRALAANLNDGGEPVAWKAHVVPVMSVVAVTAAGIIAQLDFDLSETVRDVLGLLTNPATVEGLLTGVIPDRIAFDFDAYFDQPAGLRSFLPRWRNDPATPEGERSFLLEWECDAPKVPGSAYGTVSAFLWYADEGESAGYHLTCPGDASVDMPHFPGDATAPGAAEYGRQGLARIESDGIAGGLPYIYWNDPSFGGLLLLQSDDAGTPAEENPVGRGNLQPAGQRGLNAFAAQIYDDLGL